MRNPKNIEEAEIMMQDLELKMHPPGEGDVDTSIDENQRLSIEKELEEIKKKHKKFKDKK